MGIISIKKGWSKNSKLALIGLIASIVVIVITIIFGLCFCLIYFYKNKIIRNNRFHFKKVLCDNKITRIVLIKCVIV
jgi:hypothetical protein